MIQTSQPSIKLPSVPIVTTSTTCPVETLCSNIVLSEKALEEPDHHKLYVCGDRRLGPIHLPNTGVFKAIFDGYDRFALCPNVYLSSWWDRVKGWLYPEHDGFAVMHSGGKPVPVMAELILPVGTLVDRFGSPWGSYLAPAGTPFGLRAIPMENLSQDLRNKSAPPFNYYLYNVTEQFRVRVGPIAPHFGTPGYGLQYFTDIAVDKKWNVKTLVEEGFLKDITPPFKLEF
jgi:hypothetical protein